MKFIIALFALIAAVNAGNLYHGAPAIYAAPAVYAAPVIRATYPTYAVQSPAVVAYKSAPLISTYAALPYAYGAGYGYGGGYGGYRSYGYGGGYGYGGLGYAGW